MNEQIDILPNSTLEQMALVKVATVLWNYGDIRNGFTYENVWSASCENTNTKEAWQKLENKVTDKVLGMLLPESLKLKVISCVKPIGLEILSWLESHAEAEYLAIRPPSEFFWTSHGTIDREETAVAIIKDEKIDITKRYKLACIYCLENDIKVLRVKMSERDLEACYVSENFFQYLDHYVPRDLFNYTELVNIWDRILQGKIANLPHENNGNACTPFQFAFEFAAEFGHKAATEYFFRKLTHVEREASLVRVAEYVIAKLEDDDEDYEDDDDFQERAFAKKNLNNVLRFLLSQMDNEQLEICKELNSSLLLQLCLDWPWQGFFLETAHYLQEFLSKDAYEYTLDTLVWKIINGFKDFNYQKLFRELFQLIPEIYRTYFFADKRNIIHLEFPSTLLPYLFAIKDKENISLILKDASAAEKEKIISCSEGKHLCADLVRKHEWDLLEFFVTECIASQEQRTQFISEILE